MNYNKRQLIKEWIDNNDFMNEASGTDYTKTLQKGMDRYYNTAKKEFDKLIKLINNTESEFTEIINSNFSDRSSVKKINLEFAPYEHKVSLIARIYGDTSSPDFPTENEIKDLLGKDAKVHSFPAGIDVFIQGELRGLLTFDEVYYNRF